MNIAILFLLLILFALIFRLVIEAVPPYPLNPNRWSVLKNDFGGFINHVQNFFEFNKNGITISIQGPPYQIHSFLFTDLSRCTFARVEVVAGPPLVIIEATKYGVGFLKNKPKMTAVKEVAAAEKKFLVGSDNSTFLDQLCADQKFLWAVPKVITNNIAWIDTRSDLHVTAKGIRRVYKLIYEGFHDGELEDVSHINEWSDGLVQIVESRQNQVSNVIN